MNDVVESVLSPFIEAVYGKKGENIVILDVRERTSIADYFIIVSAQSHRQVTSMADHIYSFLRDRKLKPLGMEGVQEGLWALLDYGDVIIHIFYDEMRAFYDIDGLWNDAPRVEPGLKWTTKSNGSGYTIENEETDDEN